LVERSTSLDAWRRDIDGPIAEERSHRWTLIAVCATTFMLLVDITS
jgi:hypothetical protein